MRRLPAPDIQRLNLEHRPFNLLLVPFPFYVDGKCFVAGAPIFDRADDAIDGTRSKWRFLELEQQWLRKAGWPDRLRLGTLVIF